jgi:hypothetical protein
MYRSRVLRLEHCVEPAQDADGMTASRAPRKVLETRSRRLSTEFQG